MLIILAEEAVEVAAVEEDREIEAVFAFTLTRWAEPGSAAVRGDGIIVSMGQAALNPAEMVHLARNVLAEPAVAPFAFGDLTKIAAEGAFYPALWD